MAHDEDFETCACCGTPLAGSDHCPLCGCEEHEEDPECPLVR